MGVRLAESLLCRQEILSVWSLEVGVQRRR